VAARAGVECQVGVADGLFAATLAARRGLSVEPGRTGEFLGPLDVDELDREPEVDRAELISLLRRLGLRSLGAFAELPPADVASRFGADAVLAHRLARGLDPRPPSRRQPPEELSVEIELDPPVDRVDAAAFAARALADRLHRGLSGHGLACTRLGIEARTEQGEELVRVWRCAEPLTPSGTADRVRWQLDAWLTRGGGGAVLRLRLVPEETVTAGALQLGLWGDVGASDERAGRALVRVQAMLGPEAVCTAVLGGGRDPGERVRLVPWGDARNPPPSQPQLTSATGPPEPMITVREGSAADTAAEASETAIKPGRRRGTGRRRARRYRKVSNPGREPPPSWPGRLPAPSPATVPARPLPATVLDAEGNPLRLGDRYPTGAAPHTVAVDGGTPRPVLAWAGPWPLDTRWWDPAAGCRAARFQVLVQQDGLASALLLEHRDARWHVTAVYD
jgi:protein ImuB